MIESARRVALALIIFSIIAVSYSVATSGIGVCSGFGECGAALSLYTLDLSDHSSPGATPMGPAATDDYGFIDQVVQLVSLFALIIGVSLLFSLEFSKPHRVKATKPAKKTRRRRTA